MDIPSSTIFIDVGAGAEPYTLQAEFPQGLHDEGATEAASNRQQVITKTNSYLRCVSCKYTTSDEAVYKEHVKHHNKHACKTCNFTCVTKKILAQHEKCHKDRTKKHVKESKLKQCSKIQKTDKYRCKVCSIRCKTLEVLSIHHKLCKILVEEFLCAQCEWKSNLHPQVLLHLIYHPSQVVDETAIDVSILRKNGIVA